MSVGVRPYPDPARDGKAALVFATPVGRRMIGAVLFFGESPGWSTRWAAIGLGLVGVLVIMRPGVESAISNHSALS